ncbi:MAG: helix-turn-helix domain-containing protein, partial [Saprospiraceae bacterium]
FTSKSAKTISLGEQIKNARIKRNCSQEKLAELTELAVDDIKNIETNFAVPTMDILLNIQEYLGTEFIMK